MKYLLVIVIVVVVLWLMLGRKRGETPARRDAPTPPPGAQPMVRCAHCGVHLPRSEALLLGEHTFCSAAHRDAGARPQ